MLYLLLFSAGVLSIAWLSPVLPTVWQAAAVCLFLSIAGIRFLPARYLLAWMLGVFWVTLDFSVVPGISDPIWTQKPLWIQGEIADIPDAGSEKSQFMFKVQGLKGIRQIRVKWYTPPPEIHLKPGQVWKLPVHLKPPRGYLNPGGNDYEQWLYANRIDGIAIVNSRMTPELIRTSRTLASLRYDLSHAIGNLLENSKAKALAAALLTGDRSQLAREDWQVLSNTGTSHLMAISGLHIGLMALLGYAIVFHMIKWFPQALYLWPAQYWASIAAFISASVYALMAGFSIPTQRALIMVGCVVAARLTQALIPPVRILIISLTLVLMLDPRSGLDKSFWLSFFAVAIILWILSVKPALSGYHAWQRVQWSLFLGLLPITWLFFSYISLISPFVNLVMVPLVGWLIVPLLFAGVVLLPFKSLAVPWFSLLNWILSSLWEVLQACSQWQWSSVTLVTPGFWTILSLLAAIALLALPRPAPGKWLALLFCLPLFWQTPALLNPGAFRYTVLDVGQGLASVLETRNHVLVYDVGNAYPGFDMATAAIVPYLNHRHRKRVNLLALSHQDRDHAGSASILFDTVPVDWTLALNPNQIPWHKTLPCRAGMRWRWDEVTFEVLYPFTQKEKTVRNRSCVIRVQGAHHSLLLTGDIDRTMEEALLRHDRTALRSDVMLAPHHGSATSSSSGFIHAVQPEHAIISAGLNNRFGHPDPAVERRYLNRGVTLWNTARQNAIIVESDQQLTVTGYRNAARAFWRF